MPKNKKTHASSRKGAAEFADAVAAARAKLGITQGAFAQLLETPLGTVRGWEQGRRKPPPCAMLLMRVAVDYPEVIMGLSETDARQKTPEQKPKSPGTGRKAPKKNQVVAELHQPGDEADFWLL